MKVVKIMLMLLAFAVMWSSLMFINNTSVVDAMAMSFFVVINAFLGLDLASMIKSTSKMDEGFKIMNMHRYVISLLLMAILFVTCIYRGKFIDISMATGSFGSGVLVVIGLILAGLQANKIAEK